MLQVQPRKRRLRRAVRGQARRSVPRRSRARSMCHAASSVSQPGTVARVLCRAQSMLPIEHHINPGNPLHNSGLALISHALRSLGFVCAWKCKNSSPATSHNIRSAHVRERHPPSCAAPAHEISSRGGDYPGTPLRLSSTPRTR